MDKEVRTAHEQLIVDSLLEDQMRHIKILDAMESNHGLDLDAYTDIYGGSSLDGSQKGAVELARKWSTLLAYLASSSKFVAISRINRVQVLSCTGFGGAAEYNYFDDILLVNGDAQVVSDKVDGQASLAVLANKMFRLEGARFVSTNDVTLASTGDWTLANLSSTEAPQQRLMDGATRIKWSDDLLDLKVWFSHQQVSGTRLTNQFDIDAAFSALRQAHAQ